jgi:pyridoxamine 5'-phosphate oxidase
MSYDIDIATERREYGHANLRRQDLLNDPFAQFEQWLSSARQQGVRDATAMTLATVDERGMPFQRMVLLKGLDSRGFVFFTNLSSRKAQQLQHNPLASLHFAWLSEDRQVIINGKTTALSGPENLRYFLSRPRESQLAAWASRQSHPISTRRLLEEKYREIKAKFAAGDIALPAFWGGFRLVPESIEFWQGGEYRLHDRFLYTRDTDGWWIERLSP